MARRIQSTLKQAILARGLNLKKLAEDAGVQYASLYRWMHGHRNLRGDLLDRLAEYLGYVIVPMSKLPEGFLHKGGASDDQRPTNDQLASPDSPG